MIVTITAAYAAILALAYIAVSFAVSFARGRLGVSLGDGGKPEMLVRIRQHGNMAEYVPFALLLMALAEAGGLGAAWVHAAGLLLLAGRALHLLGFSEARFAFPARVTGMLATYGAMLIAAGFPLFRMLGL